MHRTPVREKNNNLEPLYGIRNFMKNFGRTVFLALLATILVAGPVSAKNQSSARVALRDADGNAVGKMHLVQKKDGVQVTVKVQGLTPGFHGFHDVQGSSSRQSKGVGP